MKTAASVKTLQTIKDVTPEDARLIRRIWKARSLAELDRILKGPTLAADTYARPDGVAMLRDEKMAAVDRVLNTHGVEYLGRMKRTGAHVDYCNAGDPYATTVLFIGDRLAVGCWGDLVEAGRVEEGNG